MRAVPDIVLRVLLLQLMSDARHLRLRLLDVDSRFEASYHETAVPPHFYRLIGQIDRKPQVGCVRIERGHDPDDRIRPVAQRDGLASYLSVGTEAPLPEFLVQHDDVVTARLILARLEGAAQQRRDAQDGKEVSRNTLRSNRLRLSVLGQGEAFEAN